MAVERVVALGRLPHDADTGAVDRAIAEMGLETMRNRPTTELSGGELARVLIARALAQETPFLMADEPIAGLDPAAQIATMQLFGRLAREGRGVLVSLHDIGLALRHATRVVVLHEGRIAADGVPSEVITPKMLATVFGITAQLAETPEGLLFQPLDVLS